MTKEAAKHGRRFVFGDSSSARDISHEFQKTFSGLAELEDAGWILDWSSLNIELDETERHTLSDWLTESTTDVRISVRGLRASSDEEK